MYMLTLQIFTATTFVNGFCINIVTLVQYHHQLVMNLGMEIDMYIYIYIYKPIKKSLGMTQIEFELR